MKKRLSIIISIIVIVGIIVGVTLALLRKNIFTQNVSFIIDGVAVTYDAGADISGAKLLPVTTLEKGLNDGVAIEKQITVSASKLAYFNLYLDVEILDNGLKRDYVKYIVKQDNDIVSTGSFTNASVGDTLTLLSYEEINNTTTSYTLYIWIDGSVDNDGEVENQNYKFVLHADVSENDPRLDKSGANPPALVDGLIPVRYDETNSTWVKADSNNIDSNNKWYDYDNKMWANAVLVSSTNRNTYMSASAGTAIPESDVLAYYVWIPRYKYKVWNINKVIGTDSYSAQTTGIDIVFEKGKTSTGTISCNYDFTITDGSLSEICTGNNGDYYTHPAFTFGNDELTGFWMGKFELSSENQNVTNGGGISSTLSVRIKPNVANWRYNLITNFYKVIYDMQITSNIYGLNTSRTNTDSHMIKSMEWGATAYLTNSKYGRCTNNVCTEVTVNNSSEYITGGNNYVINVDQSTTGNITGIYDMSGGSEEYVMGNMSSVAGSYTYNESWGGSNYVYTGNEKYIDTYAYGTSEYNQIAYNRSRLGDAIGESVTSDLQYTGKKNFVKHTSEGDDCWFVRLSILNFHANTGSVYYNVIWGETSNLASTRAVLVSL